MMPSLYPYSGNVLDQTQASTQQAFNNGWRRFQDALCDAGSERFQQEIIIEGIPPVANFDPSVQCSISWFGCFDGDSTTVTPALPPDLIEPLWMSERMSGSLCSFPPPDTPNMRCFVDGLPMQRKWQFNGCWEWRGEVIYYPGATYSVDFRIRYRQNVPDIANSGTQQWYMQPVPVVRCQDPLAWWICAEFATSESAKPNASPLMLQLAMKCQAEAMRTTKLFANRDAMKNERVEARRIPYGAGSGGQGNSNGGYGGGY